MQQATSVQTLSPARAPGDADSLRWLVCPSSRIEDHPPQAHTVAPYRRDLQELLSHVLSTKMGVAEEHPHVPMTANQGNLRDGEATFKEAGNGFVA